MTKRSNCSGKEGRKCIHGMVWHGPLVNAGKSLATVVDTDYLAHGLSNTLVNMLHPQPAGRIYATRRQCINQDVDRAE